MKRVITLLAECLRCLILWFLHFLCCKNIVHLYSLLLCYSKWCCA
jgi:hypothetical protein